MKEAPQAADVPSLTVGEVDAAFEALSALSGAGSVAARRAALAALLGRATASEQAFLRALVLGDLRQGALTAIVGDAVAKAASVPVAVVRRALMLRGDLGAVAVAALGEGGAEALAAFRLEVGRPVSPMLASTAPDVEAALEKTGPAAVEWKLDGARIQVHRSGDEVGDLHAVAGRRHRAAAGGRGCRAVAGGASFVLDGEAIALRDDGRPHPFQVTGSRFASRSGGAVQLTPMFFDVLHLDGADLLDRPGVERASALSALVPAQWLVPRGGPELLESALAMGHEGVVVKSLAAPYEAGRRGAAWVKVKPVHTLDLVVLGVEWGSGRRRGKLSNLHLGARGPDGGFVMLGKTFKGLTDAMLAWQTEKLLALEELARRPRRVRAAGAGGRDRLRRRPDQPALSRRRRVALRARGALPGGQAGVGGGHDRVRARAARVRRWWRAVGRRGRAGSRPRRRRPAACSSPPARGCAAAARPGTGSGSTSSGARASARSSLTSSSRLLSCSASTP